MAGTHGFGLLTFASFFLFLVVAIPVNIAMTHAGAIAQQQQQHVYQEGLPTNLSPACWRSSLQAIAGLNRATSRDAASTASPTRDLCNAMSFVHQKALAVEMARCHLADLHRPLFSMERHDEIESNNHLPNCLAGPLVDTDTLQLCLPLMTDVGVQAYTAFLTHVHQACLRLSEELWLLQQHEVSERIYDASQRALDALDELTRQQQDLRHATAVRENEMALQHGVILGCITNQRELFHRQVSELYQKQQDGLQQQQDGLLERLKDREDDLVLYREAWVRNHTEWIQLTTAKHQEQQDDLEGLSEVCIG